MLKIFYNFFSNLVIRLVFLILIMMVVLAYSSGHFIFVKAYSNQVNIFPGVYEVDEGSVWQGVANIFYQDLSGQDGFSSFSFDNSAYIVSTATSSPKNNATEHASNEKKINNTLFEIEVKGNSKNDEPEEEFEKKNIEADNGGKEEEESSVLEEGPEIGDSNNNQSSFDQEDSKNEEPLESSETNTVNLNASEDSVQGIENHSEPGTSEEPLNEEDGEINNSDSDEEISFFGKAKAFFTFFEVPSFFQFAQAEAIATSAVADTGYGETQKEIKHSLVLSDFSVPLGYKENGIGETKLRLSLAAMSDYSDDKLLLEYYLAGSYRPLGVLSINNQISNSIVGDYFQFIIKDELKWDDLAKLKIKISYQSPHALDKNNSLTVFLDAAWLEVSYGEDVGKGQVASSSDNNFAADSGQVMGVEEDLAKDSVLLNNEYILGDEKQFKLDLLSDQIQFKTTEAPHFKFKYSEKKNLANRLLSRLTSIFWDEYSSLSIKVKVFDQSYDEIPKLHPTIHYLKDGEFSIDFGNLPREFKPGLLFLEISLDNGEEIYRASQNFAWGVLAINTSKSIYQPGETAYLQMAVLDEKGNTLCDLEYLTLEIKDPAGRINYLSTYNGKIIINEACGPNNVIDSPDYYAYYPIDGVGEYHMSLKAQTDNGLWEIEDSFFAHDDDLFSIERIGPTRIYPPADYRMSIKISSKIDFKGILKEEVPNSFSIQTPGDHRLVAHPEYKTIVWPLDLIAGEEYKLEYSFDAPNVSPEFYLLGPSQIEEADFFAHNNEEIITPIPMFSEARQWQIAADAIDPLEALFSKQRTDNSIGGTEESLVSITSGFSADETYFIFGGVGSHRWDSGSGRYELGLMASTSNSGGDSQTHLAHLNEQTESPAADDGASLFVMGKRYWDNASDNLYLQGEHLTSAGQSDEVFIMAMATSTMGTFKEDYFWQEYINTSDLDGNPGRSILASTTVSANGTDQYLVIAQIEADVANTSEFVGLDIYDGANSMVSAVRDTEDTNDTIILTTATTTVLATGDTTFSVRAWGELPDTADHLSSRIFVIRLNYYEDFSCHAISDGGAVGTAASVFASTNLSLTQSGNVVAMYFGAFSATDRASDVSLRARFDSTIEYQNDENDGNNIAGRNNVWSTSDIHSTLWFDEVSVSDTSSHTYDLSYERGGTAGATVKYAMVCAWSERANPIFYAHANEQYKGDGVTAITNNSWSNSSSTVLSGLVSNAASTTTQVDYYFELISDNATPTSTIAAPANSCNSGVSFASCSNKIWHATKTPIWYDSDWSYRKKVSIDSSQVLANEIDFPVLLAVIDGDLAFSDHGGHVASSTGGDLIITDAGGTTTLDFERELYASSTGEIAIWVKADISSSTDTDFYIYYGNSSASKDYSNASNVFGSVYAMVYHLGEPDGTSGTGSVGDSTGNTSGTPSGGIDFGESGQTGRSTDFSSGTGINCGTVGSSILSATTTVSYWINTIDYASPSRQNPFNQAYGGWGTQTLETNSTMSWYHGDNGGDGSNYQSIGSQALINNNEWTYVVAVRNPNGPFTYAWYKNGAYLNGGTYNSSYPVIANHTFYIGDGYTNPLNGRIDEFRVTNEVRDANWIKTEYNNQANSASFLTWDSEESMDYAYEGLVTIPAIPDSGVGYRWQAMACENGGSCSTWNQFNQLRPNFYVDTTLPSTPGNLVYYSKTKTSITLSFGNISSDTNFDRYRIFYKAGSSGVDVDDSEHTDANLLFADYNSATSTTISDLDGGTEYVINIFAYDLAGNYVGASELSVTTNEAGRARTVEFFANNWSGTGTSSDGQLSDTNQTLSAFNFSLIETDANIKNAYLIFEAQFEAFSGYAQDHTGYNLAFDVCQEPCTANAFSGSGKVLEDDNNILAYREGESTYARILLDVTDEAQLAAYSGGGVNLEGQVGYRIETGSAQTSIASAKARLVITYTYEDTSPSITNTVIYPLESTYSGDSGARQSSQSDDCTLDSNCPLFNYQVELPEMSESEGASRLSSWFSTYNVNDGHGDNDVFIDVNIEGTDATNSLYIHESAMGGTQGNMPALDFSNVPGFNENVAQILEYHGHSPEGGITAYLLGGEIIDTYTASSAAATKTRTVSFPLGVVNNGLTAATTSKSVTVYFPENGKGSGVVDIKKAWLRIISNNANSGSNYIKVSTKVGANSSSQFYNYHYNVGGTIIKPSFHIIHLIPSGDYGELEKANVTIGKAVTLSTVNTNQTDQGGLSAELMITYTYTSENQGYLNSMRLYAGQTSSNPEATTTAATAKTVMPEPAGTKTILAAALLPFYLVSDSSGGVRNYLTTSTLDVDLSATTAVCSNEYNSRTDSTNAFTEYYQDVSSELTADNAQSYNVCYSNNTVGRSQQVAKMNGQLLYTYQYYTSLDISSFIDNQYKSNGVTAITNQHWTNESEVKLSGLATDSNSSTTQIDFYFENFDESNTFSSSTTTSPSGACSSGTAYESCSSKIWTVNVPSASLDPWYNTSWQYRKKISVNAGKVADDLSDFVMLATTTDSSLAYLDHGGHMGLENGEDIIVVADNGTTVLPHDRDYYSSSTGELILWIKTDLSSSTNKDIYVYYGNYSTSTDQADPDEVWADYSLVHHFEEPSGTSGSGSVTDSVGNANGTPSSGISFGASGLIGTAVDTSGGTGINCGALGSPILTASTTISYWINTSDFASPSRQNPFEQAYGGWGTMTIETSGAISYFFGSNGGNSSPYGSHQSNTGAISDNEWIYMVSVRSPSGYTYNWYKNGSFLNGSTYNSSFPVINSRTFTIGDGYTNPLNGRLDEFRVAKVVRSAEWVETEYNNQSSPSSFAPFASSEESLSTMYYEGTVSVVSLPDRGTVASEGYKWQMMTCSDSGQCTSWEEFGIPPNYKVDANPPSAPGNLSLATTTATSILLNLGSVSSDVNFSEYRIYYKKGLSGVSVDDSLSSDANLSYVDYNSATTTTINNLEADTQYVINIWAFDLAGNKTSAVSEISVTTNSASHARGRSVRFPAGFYSGNGSTGQLSDTNQTFSTFNFQLAETEVELRNAYILFEAQAEAYHTNSGNYSGFNLAFDACEEPCTADAFSGTDRVLKDDNSILAYKENSGGGNQFRLLFDVSNEVQLSAYEGDSGNMEAQIGYRIETGSATTSISAAKAMLILSYAYNEDNSANYTNSVIFPLESNAGGDSGSRKNSQAVCTIDSNCPLFSYNADVPELSAKLFQWFEMYEVNDGNGGTDINVNVNIEGSDVNSDTYIHESFNGGTQGVFPMMIYKDVYGFSEGNSQNLEYSVSGAGTHYLIGGENHITYTAAKSASTKTRTVSFPLGVVANGQSISTASATVEVYFPENGEGSGVVDIKKAWLRVISNNIYSGSESITLATKVGDNAQSGNSIYNLDVGGSVIKPAFTIIHVVPSGDYSELESANATSPKDLTLYSTNGSSNLGGVAAELMITYSYSSESTGYLSTINLYGGQSAATGNSQSTSALAANGVFPELRGDETVRGAQLKASYLINDSDNQVPTWFTLGVNIATSSPVCTTAFNGRTDSYNAFLDYFEDVSASLLTTDKQSYTTCFANDNSSSDASAGAKMNAILTYTYQYDAVPPEFTQNDWRWYENIDAIQPSVSKAVENTSINTVHIGQVLRLRMSAGVTQEDLSASTQTFKLQYGAGSVCSGIVNWYDVGGISGSEPWLGYNNSAPNDGSTISTTLLSSSTVAESYEESNPSASNPNTVVKNGIGEWDWVVYNNNASSSADYCFRMAKGDGQIFEDYLTDSYPQLTTAASNTPPNAPNSLGQYRSDGVTVVANLSWINEDSIRLTAAATDPNINQELRLYFELASSTASFTIATSVPSGACISGTAYNSCGSKTWYATSTSGDWRENSFKATTSIISLPESAIGYKWQVMACDQNNVCSAWTDAGADPNFKVDTSAPDAPGSLSFIDATSISINLGLGASTSETNFDRYRIFYKVGSSGVTETDNEHSDSSLLDIDYNSATTTKVINLSAGTNYVFNIWAYDQAGNKASATLETIGSTSPAYTPPTGFIDNSSAQKTDGSGIVDMVILVDDPDNNDTLRAKIFYEVGDTCAFSSMTNIRVDETDSSITATYGDPDADTTHPYQIGTSTAWIETSPGANYVFFDWLSAINIPAANGDYCLGLVVNDGGLDQTATHTKVMTLDNLDPAIPGALSSTVKTYDSVILNFGLASSDTNFKEYKIFYKVDSSGVSETDSVWNQTNDTNLGSENYGGAATTTVTGLSPNTQYFFNIWAYDDYGNKASATVELAIKTNASPTNISADNQYLSDGISIIANDSWISQNDVVLGASVHDQDANDLITFYYELITATGTYSVSSEEPASSCASSTAFLSCSNKIWAVSTSSSILPSDWYNKDWLYRKKITINSSQVATSADNFIVLATTTDSDLASDARSDGYDIVFTDASGTSTLYYDREYYNSSSGELAAWIRTDVSSTSDTVLYMYYGNAQTSTDQASSTLTWAGDWAGVWHLAENVVDEASQQDAHIDSVLSPNHGYQYGNNESDGWVSQAQDFDGNNDYIDFGNTNKSINSLSFWGKGNVALDLDGGSHSLFIKDNQVITVGFDNPTIYIDGETNYSYSYQKQIVISASQVVATESNFVVLATTTDLNLRSSAHGGHVASSSGGDIYFTASDGVTKLDYERESYSSSTGELIVWVETDISSTTDTVLYMFYGDSSISSDQENRSGVWGSEYAMVHHMEEPAGTTGSNSVTDSAGNANGTPSGGIVFGANGAIGKSVDFSGGTGISMGSLGSSLLEATSTVSYWIYVNDITSPNRQNPFNHSYGGWSTQTLETNGAISWFFGSNGGDGSPYTTYSSGSGYIGSGAWYYLVITRDPSNNYTYAHYRNGAYYVGGTYNSSYPNIQSQTFTVGDGYTNAINGYIDEFRVVNAVRSSAWIGTEYNNQKSVDDFLSFNSEQLVPNIGSGWHQVALVSTSSITVSDFKVGRIGNSYFSGQLDELHLNNNYYHDSWYKTANNGQKDVASFLSIGQAKGVTSTHETVLVLNVPDNPGFSSGYKWQVMACDDDGDCSPWTQFNTTVPNFKIDTIKPTAPGILALQSKTANSITLNFGAQSTEANFSEYRLYYSTSTPVGESDNEQDNSDLDYIDYNSSSDITVNNLNSNTSYYFSLWVYDVVSHKASSTAFLATTNASVSSPGVSFYTKGDRSIYYRVWSGSAWGSEQTGPTLGSNANFYIRHLDSVRSDDGGKIAIIAKTATSTSAEWWASVYRFTANDFVNTSQLGQTQNTNTNNEEISACLAALSGGEFMALRSNSSGAVSDGSLAFSWNTADGWSSEGNGPSPGAVLHACKLIRRPGTDNYLFITHDDDNDIGTAYYTGGSSYSNSWTSWTQHSGTEEDINNFIGDVYFDPSDNTRGAINYSNSSSNHNTQAKFFFCNNSSINYGAAVTSPSTWNDDFVHGEFASDPGGTGVAYYAGTDIDRELNIYKVDISSNAVVWSSPTNGDNISDGELYAYTNDAQKPFAIKMYKSGRGVVTWTERNSTTPKYRNINDSGSSVSAASSTVSGSSVNQWTRVRLYEDPEEQELLAVYQNNDVDYTAVFWDGSTDSFYSSGNQAWTELAANTSAYDIEDDNFTFAYTAYNSPPNTPSASAQYKSDASTTIANQAWTNESSVKLIASVTDPDTDEILTIYLQLLANSDTFASSTSEPSNACASSTAFNACSSKIWAVASSSGDFSLLPFTATATITALSQNYLGYKWQIIACDDDAECSSWSVFNATTPNFKVDLSAPTAPGGLTITNVSSETVTLQFGAASTEDNFYEYEIHYRASSSGAVLDDTEHVDADLSSISYNSTTNTLVLALATSTEYVFNIWAFDLAGNFATATPEVATTTTQPARLEQTSYLWENDDAGNVNSNTASTSVDTAINSIHIGERILARIQIENFGEDSADNKTYFLQFENQSDSPGTWITVGASSEISYSLALSGSNGQALSSPKASANTNTWQNGTWHENTGQTGSYSLGGKKYTEFVFALETSQALTGKTYRLRLYNNTDNKILETYTNYPTLTTLSSDTIRYSKQSNASLPSTNADLTYYLDPFGYYSQSLDDNVNRDKLTVSNYPLYLFAQKHTSNSDAISVSWNGSSTVAASARGVYLQVYKFGSPDQWVSVASNTTAAVNEDFSLSANLNSSLANYYDGSYWTYWRVYQESGSQTLTSDYFHLSFSAPTAETKLIHYRWRSDDGNETAASWRENEDTGDPVEPTVALSANEKIRLRIGVVNNGGGTASNYNYEIQYASTSNGLCSGASNWSYPTSDWSGDWHRATSTQVSDDDSSTEQLTNSENYSFVGGKIVAYPSASSSAISLSEDEYSELEYVLSPTSNSFQAGTYCFRLLNNASALDTYSEYPIITLSGNTNNAPAFSVLPSDNGSASTSPTNEGGSISFSATAGDQEGNNYYLAICKSNSISAGNDAAPTCGGGEWCISSATASGTEASCSYTATDSSETPAWYAFVCDKEVGIGIAKCSVSSQGSGSAINDSPLAINHAPDFTNIVTSTNNLNPGGTFVITASATDNDTADGADTLRLHVCSTNSASFAGCGGFSLCSDTSSTTPNASCSFATTTPATSGDWTYYAFVFDSHGLAASDNSRSSTYTVNNVRPTMGNLILNGGLDITLNIKGASDTTVSTINTSVQDLNGCNSLVSAVGTIYLSQDDYNCSNDQNDCYQITTTNCIKSDCASSSDTVATYTCTANMKHFANPSDNASGNPKEPYTWMSYMLVYDGANYSLPATSTGVELITVSALDVNEESIDFGTWLVGDNTGTINSTSTIINAGNSPIDTNISGIDMSGTPSGVIDVTNIKWSLSNFNYPVEGSPLSDGDIKVEIIAPKATTTAYEITDEIYWGIGIPYTASSSSYIGRNTFSVVLDNDDW